MLAKEGKRDPADTPADVLLPLTELGSVYGSSWPTATVLGSRGPESFGGSYFKLIVTVCVFDDVMAPSKDSATTVKTSSRFS